MGKWFCFESGSDTAKTTSFSNSVMGIRKVLVSNSSTAPYIMKTDNTREPSHLFPPIKEKKTRLVNHTHNDDPREKKSHNSCGNAKPSCSPDLTAPVLP